MAFLSKRLLIDRDYITFTLNLIYVIKDLEAREQRSKIVRPRLFDVVAASHKFSLKLIEI